MASHRERTFIMVKPDGVQRGLVGEIIARFEKRGFKLVALKMLQPTESLLQQHYAEHVGKPFFAGIVKFMVSGPVVAMVWEGTKAVSTCRSMLGKTCPLESPPGTIRGDYGIDTGRNVVHGSDGVESAAREISLWFGDRELTNWSPAAENWVYENAA